MRCVGGQCLKSPKKRIHGKIGERRQDDEEEGRKKRRKRGERKRRRKKLLQATSSQGFSLGCNVLRLRLLQL